MAEFRAQHMIPDSMASCHTAILEESGYFVEGHIPVAAIDKLLRDDPGIDGIAMPGMPPGSPGMRGAPEAPLEIWALSEGVYSPFAAMGSRLLP
jgi:hypothetical protein